MNKIIQVSLETRTKGLEADEPRIGQHDKPNTSCHQKVINQNENDNTGQGFTTTKIQQINKTKNEKNGQKRKNNNFK